jgi:hypothetical protein
VRELRFAGASTLILPDADSALVQGAIPDSLAAGGWTASVSSARLALTTSSGDLSTPVRWSRPGQALDPGLYVDTVNVSLQRAPTVVAQFVDSIEVVMVSAPPPDGAVSDLFDHSSLTDDQRLALDRQGNNNGQYDLGDFLAWVNRNHIRLSESVGARLLQVRTKP